jgi:hypothetical protein
MMKRHEQYTELEILLARCAVTCGLPYGSKMRNDNLAELIAWLNEEVK